MDKINVLISLHKGYGLGDAVMVSSILRHAAKYRPEWIVDYQAEEGRHCVGRGICSNTFFHGALYPSPHYAAEVQICLYDAWHAYDDRPNTHVVRCLKDTFGMDWDAACGRYQVTVSLGIAKLALSLVTLDTKERKPNKRVVAIHYQGTSAAAVKNLTHEQAAAICKAVERLGGTPLLMDWLNTSPLPHGGIHTNPVRTLGRHPMAELWGGNAEINCAVIGKCAAFIGIDSGPGKCASATDTPALIIWTGHHPSAFHDPAPNTTHLVPVGFHGLEPVCDNRSVINWFNNHYKIKYYSNHSHIAIKVGEWLREVIT